MRLIDADQLLDFIRFDERAIAPEGHTAEDIVMMIQTAPTIAPPPNDPLTLEQLREMDGEPVWVVRGEGEGRWALIRFVNNYGVGTHGCGFLGFEDWQVDWWAYRRKPEELAP